MPSTDAFTRTVEEALEQLDQPAVLGQRSPLAAPYFLGQHLETDSEASTPAGRGRTLGGLLRQAAGSLTDDQREVLNVAFFEAHQQPSLNELRAGKLHRSLRTYYRDRTAAIQALAVELGRLVVPPLKAEMPRVRNMAGRDDELSAALAILQSGKSLAITGPGGSGKTTLGAHITAGWPGESHFWFTLRSGFSDNMSALLFSLCHCLRSLGASSAWLQLIADAGKDNAPIEISRIRPMLRHDIEHIQQLHPDQSHPLLICVDDIDLLDAKRADHDRVLDVIRELRDLVPLLLIGQHLVIDTDHLVQIAGLSSGDVAKLIQYESQAVSMTPDEIERVTTATQGLPAYVRLFLLLHTMGEPVESTLRQNERDPSFDALFQRVWMRLNEASRQLLMQIAVYDGHAPADEWPDLEKTSEHLVESGLLEINAHAGVALSSFARPAVLRRITPALMPALNLQAAQALEQRGEYTAAARQYLQAKQPLQAIALWAAHRAGETERGQAEAALAMLQSISPESLQNDDERRVLLTLRAELHRKLGALLDGLEDLSLVTWPAAHELTPFAEMLRGDLHEFSGNIEASLSAYDTALRALAGWREVREVELHNRIGFIRLYRARDLELAAQAAIKARFQAESFHGKVLEGRGNFAGAQARYEAAAALLDQLEHSTSSRAMSESDLGRIALSMGRYDEAITRIREAIGLYGQVGDQALLATEHMNLSYTLNAAGDHEQALDVATRGLQLAQEIGDTYIVSALACNAAEACANLDRLDEADQYAMLALHQEEEFHRHYILTVQGVVHGKRGNHEQATQHFIAAIQMAQACEDPFGEAPAWRWLALDFAQQNRGDEARDALASATALYQKMGQHHEITHNEAIAAAWRRAG